MRVVANLPYSIAAPLLRRLLDLRGALAGWAVMIQREVALRLLAAPGSRDYGSLAVLHRLCVAVSRVRDLSPGCFFPAPQVRLDLRAHAPRTATRASTPTSSRASRVVVRAAFGQRRKTLANSLRGAGLAGGDARAAAAACEDAGLDPRARAETPAAGGLRRAGARVGAAPGRAVSAAELLEALQALARELELEVRVAPGGDATTSGVCRLRGRPWVLLAASDPLERRVAVLAGALRAHAGAAARRATCRPRCAPRSGRDSPRPRLDRPGNPGLSCRQSRGESQVAIPIKMKLPNPGLSAERQEDTDTPRQPSERSDPPGPRRRRPAAPSGCRLLLAGDLAPAFPCASARVAARVQRRASGSPGLSEPGRSLVSGLRGPGHPERGRRHVQRQPEVRARAPRHGPVALADARSAASRSRC